MSYRCENCNVVANCSPSLTVVTETRKAVYPGRLHVNEHRHEGEKYTTNDKGGQGFETVKQLRVCRKCQRLLNR